jgi:hypothetical protein
MGAVAIEQGKAARFRRALKIDRLLTEFAGLLSDLGADDFVADIAAMRAKNAQRMTDEDQLAAYENMVNS